MTATAQVGLEQKKYEKKRELIVFANNFRSDA